MLSLGLASAQEAPQVTKDGTMQRQCTGDQDLTRARELEVIVDSSRTGGLGHTEGILSGNLGKRARRGAGGSAEEEEIMNWIGYGE